MQFLKPIWQRFREFIEVSYNTPHWKSSISYGIILRLGFWQGNVLSANHIGNKDKGEAKVIVLKYLVSYLNIKDGLAQTPDWHFKSNKAC